MIVILTDRADSYSDRGYRWPRFSLSGIQCNIDCRDLSILQYGPSLIKSSDKFNTILFSDGAVCYCFSHLIITTSREYYKKEILCVKNAQHEKVSIDIKNIKTPDCIDILLKTSNVHPSPRFRDRHELFFEQYPGYCSLYYFEYTKNCNMICGMFYKEGILSFRYRDTYLRFEMYCSIYRYGEICNMFSAAARVDGPGIDGFISAFLHRYRNYNLYLKI